MSGSKTAKDGFKNEQVIASLLGSVSPEAQQLKAAIGITGETLTELVHGKKSDIWIVSDLLSFGIQTKKADANFNHVARYKVDKYGEVLGMPDDVVETLKMFCGDIKVDPDKKRLFMKDISKERVDNVLEYLSNNKRKLLEFVFYGEDPDTAPKYYIVTYQDKYHVFNTSDVVDYYMQSEPEVSPRSSLKIGGLTIQRKGGQGSPNDLQIKIKPLDLIRNTDYCLFVT